MNDLLKKIAVSVISIGCIFTIIFFHPVNIMAEETKSSTIYLDKNLFRATLEELLTEASNAEVYFGNEEDYGDLSAYELYVTIGTNDYYSVYVNKKDSFYYIYVICKNDEQIHFQ